jgi:hypothetical protein
MPDGTVEAATLVQHGPPPLTRSPVSTSCSHYPGGPVQVRLSAASPDRAPRTPGGSVSTTSLSRPAQASTRATARRFARPLEANPRFREGRLLSQGFDPAGCPTEPPASYRTNRPLPRWDLHPHGDRALRGRTGVSRRSQIALQRMCETQEPKRIYSVKLRVHSVKLCVEPITTLWMTDRVVSNLRKNALHAIRTLAWSLARKQPIPLLARCRRLSRNSARPTRQGTSCQFGAVIAICLGLALLAQALVTAVGVY